VIALAVGALRIYGCGTIEVAELRALDYRMRLRGPGEASPEVAVVAVDDRSILEHGRWPWPRALQAELMERIAAAGAAVVGVDIVQSEAEAECRLPPGSEESIDPRCREELGRALASGGGETRLAEAIRASGNTVLGYYFDFDPDRHDEDAQPLDEGVYKIVRHSSDQRGEAWVRRATAVTRNLPEFDAAARSLGYFNFFPDGDGLYRRIPLAIRFGERIATPLSLTMLAALWPERNLAISFDPFGVESIRFGATRIPVSADGQMLVNYRGARRTFQHVAATDLLRGAAPPDALRAKLVLLGVTAVAVGDVRATPLDPVFPGVEIHANVLDNVLRGDFVFQAARREISAMVVAELAMILGLAVLLALLLARARGWRGAIAAAVVLAGSLAASQWLFTETGAALRVIYPSLALALTYVTVSAQHYISQERETRETRRMLDLYLSPAVARELSAHPEMLKLGGEKSDRTVLFSDVREFTGISERLEPEDLVELLNLYLGEMTDIVFKNDGMLDKYIGDGLMAVWGAPIHQEDHTARACRAALAMIAAMEQINAAGAARGWPEMEIRIGLGSGPMVFGNMGSSRHLSLTVMGDNVNLGARLEGVNKLYGTSILASEATVSGARADVVAREIDLVRVKGKTQVVRIYEILAPIAEAERWAEVIRSFEAGLAAYRARRWEEAMARFEEVLALRPGDGPARLYLGRCRDAQSNPPPEGWEAVMVFGA
jgi:adenylate cyclase